MLIRYLLCWLLAVHLLSSTSAGAQALPSATTTQLDALFQSWTGNATPGCAVGIIRHDSLLYAKGFGMANLEDGVVNTPQTLFNIGSVSKQFTAYAVVLLARQGKLSLDDDVRKYLPWFPDFKARITLRHLLTHTSGVRDYLELWELAGSSYSDVQSMPRARQTLRRQRALNFQPGTDWLYSNSGYVLLAEVVQTVSHRSLRAFTDSAIFKPLGMPHTHFQDDYTRLLPGRAASYDSRGPAAFSNNALTSSVVGDGGVYTTVEDLGKWLQNFYAPKVGDQQDITTLTQRAVLTSGQRRDYALGINNTVYHGQPFYTHNGADGGYRASIGVFPQQQLGFIVLSNLGSAGTDPLLYKMADLFVKDRASPTPAAKPLLPDSSQAVLTDTAGIRRLTGTYHSDDGIESSYRLQNRKLYWMSYGRKYLLIKTHRDTFAVLNRPTIKFQFVTAPGAAVTLRQYWPGNQRVFYKDVPTPPLSNKQLLAYVGTYDSPELDVRDELVLRNHQLVLLDSHGQEFKLTTTRPDVWRAAEAGYYLKILRNRQQKITGFSLNSGRVQGLSFKKLP